MDKTCACSLNVLACASLYATVLAIGINVYAFFTSHSFMYSITYLQQMQILWTIEHPMNSNIVTKHYKMATCKTPY